jgi:hypothetical protein
MARRLLAAGPMHFTIESVLRRPRGAALLGSLAACTLCGCAERPLDIPEPAIVSHPRPMVGPPGDVVDASADDLIPDRPMDLACAPCPVPGPGHFCGLDIEIAPFVTGGVFGGFQSNAGTGQSRTIEIRLSAPTHWLRLVVMDPDFAGNALITRDDSGMQLTRTDVPHDDHPGILTTPSVTLSEPPFVGVSLIPAPGDYVAYRSLEVIPADCSAR